MDSDGSDEKPFISRDLFGIVCHGMLRVTYKPVHFICKEGLPV
jgi:hypothetical protein